MKTKSLLYLFALTGCALPPLCEAAVDTGVVDQEAMARTLISSLHEIFNPPETDQTVLMELYQNRDIQKKMSESANKRLANQSGFEKRSVIMRWRMSPNGRSCHIIRTKGPDSKDPQASVKSNLITIDLADYQKRVILRNPDIHNISPETIAEKQIDTVTAKRVDLFPEREIGARQLASLRDRLLDILSLAKTFPEKSKQISMLQNGKVGFAYETDQNFHFVEFDPSFGFLPVSVTARGSDGTDTLASFAYERVGGRLQLKEFRAARLLNGELFMEDHAQVVSRREPSSVDLTTPNPDFKNLCIDPKEIKSLLHQ